MSETVPSKRPTLPDRWKLARRPSGSLSKWGLMNIPLGAPVLTLGNLSHLVVELSSLFWFSIPWSSTHCPKGHLFQLGVGRGPGCGFLNATGELTSGWTTVIWHSSRAFSRDGSWRHGGYIPLTINSGMHRLATLYV